MVGCGLLSCCAGTAEAAACVINGLLNNAASTDVCGGGAALRDFVYNDNALALWPNKLQLLLDVCLVMFGNFLREG